MIEKNILVGTYHKTGSVWMYNVFLALAKALNVPFYHISAHTEFYKTQLGSKEAVDNFFQSQARNGKPAIIFDDHSHFGNIGDDIRNRFVGVRLIRNPISIIGSSAKYHQWSEENWLHQPMKKFEGLTYQQKIKSLENDNLRYLFEMEHTAKKTIRDMSSFPNWPFFKTFEFEKLLTDSSFVYFTKMFAHLGLSGEESLKALKCVFDNSTFGKVEPSQSAHIQSTNQKDYGTDWNDEAKSFFLKHFDKDMVKLGFHLPKALSIQDGKI